MLIVLSSAGFSNLYLLAFNQFFFFFFFDEKTVCKDKCFQNMLRSSLHDAVVLANFCVDTYKLSR